MQLAATTGEQSSRYVTPETAKSALRLVAPMIEQVLGDRNVVASGFLYIVIMDPALTPTNAAFERSILYEQAFGDCPRWATDYAGFARAKARLAWTLARRGHSLQQALPHLSRSGATVVAGGVYLDGLVVAASGASPAYDECFAGTVALCLRALARRNHDAEMTGVALEHCQTAHTALAVGPPS